MAAIASAQLLLLFDYRRDGVGCKVFPLLVAAVERGQPGGEEIVAEAFAVTPPKAGVVATAC